ncbi:hypothetical protein [Hyphococcus luteus]|uniref:Uncharacterized protein n=1 Tax=Hyphococcus luteus TaxID=2058213 RepID=A0A2S7K3Z5_9PROT|nr:hypothetical protein [Marinicaulis flavus]PQA87230.1 hypothetical protein CW354_12410 [Marinicaulis flavus]
MKSNIFLVWFFLLAALNACATPVKNGTDTAYDSWAAQLYPNDYARLRDFFHLHKKEIGFTEGVTILALPTFHSLIGIEIVHKVRVAEHELNSIDRPKYWMNISIYDPKLQAAEKIGDVQKYITRLDKYEMPLTPEQYRTLVNKIEEESGILLLPEDALPAFGCTDGITVFADIRTASIQRFEGRHVCDDGFEALKTAAEIVFTFAEKDIPELESRLNEIREYYWPGFTR